MRSFVSGMAAVMIASGASAEGLEVEKLQGVAEATRTACLSGTQYDLTVNADGSLSLFRRLAPAAEGKTRITQNSGTGGALNYTDEGKRLIADQQIRECVGRELPLMLTAAGAHLATEKSGPRACRIPVNGVERYGNVFETSQVSSWMGGGFDQAKWCEQVVAVQRGQHPGALVDVLRHSEDSHSTCAPFNCPQYQYTCTVKVSADPVYYEKISADCP